MGGASGSPSPRSLRSAPSHVDPSLPSSPSMKGLKPAADEWSGRDEDKGLLGWASGVLGSILYSAAQGSGSGREEPGPKPDFLPPVPWFTGTSADIAKTAIHLSIAVNLFLGRFDIRVMQALQGSYLKRNGPAAGLGHGAGAGASAASLPNGSVASSAPEDDLPEGAEGHRSATHDKMYQGRPPVGPHVSRSVPQPESLGGPAPHHGDGYTYEHLARRTCITMVSQEEVACTPSFYSSQHKMHMSPLPSPPTFTVIPTLSLLLSFFNHAGLYGRHGRRRRRDVRRGAVPGLPRARRVRPRVPGTVRVRHGASRRRRRAVPRRVLLPSAQGPWEGARRGAEREGADRWAGPQWDRARLGAGGPRRKFPGDTPRPAEGGRAGIGRGPMLPHAK